MAPGRIHPVIGHFGGGMSGALKNKQNIDKKGFDDQNFLFKLSSSLCFIFNINVVLFANINKISIRLLCLGIPVQAEPSLTW